MLVARMARLMDQQQVDQVGRYLIINPIMRDEASGFLNADFGESGGLRNSLILNNFHRFRVYTSSNFPKVGTGAGASAVAN